MKIHFRKEHKSLNNPFNAQGAESNKLLKDSPSEAANKNRTRTSYLNP